MKKLLNRLKNSKILKKIFAFICVFVIVFSCLVIPSSAAEESSDRITDVMYSSWYIPPGWSCSRALFYDTTMYYKSSFSDPDISIFGFSLGYKMSSTGGRTQYADYIPLSMGSVTNITPQTGFYITFLSGTKLDDPILINWLYDNGVLLSHNVTSSFSSDYQSIAPIYVNNFSGDSDLVAFPSAHSLPLSHNGETLRNYLDSSDYTLYDDLIKYKDVNGLLVPYITLHLDCNYSSVYLNNVAYSGSFSSDALTASLSGVTSCEFYPVENSFVSGTTYFYNFDIVLGNFVDSTQIYAEGYASGFVNGFYEGFEQGEIAFSDSAYNQGFADGVNSSDSENLGQNLLGDTLSAPIDALNEFTLYESSSGLKVTLGLVLGGVICLSIFIAFLKIFAGG